MTPAADSVVGTGLRKLARFHQALRVHQRRYQAKANDWSTTNWRLVGIILVGLVAIFGASGLYTKYEVQQMLKADAERSAEYWAKQFIKDLPGLREIAEGRELTTEERSKVYILSKVGSVFRFKLFDGEGRLRLVSDDLKSFGASGQSLKSHNDKAAGVLATFKPYVKFASGAGKANRPDYYSEAYVPIMESGKTYGVVEVYLDQTNLHAEYTQRAQKLALVLSLITAFVFGVPAIAFYYRSEEAARSGQKLSYLAKHDALTGTPNRTAFQDYIQATLGNLKSGQKVGLLCMDLDNFKPINDSLGHDIGDKLLCAVARRLENAIRERDFCSRLGGDEFVVVLPNIKDERECEQIATRIIEAVSKPFGISDHTVIVGMSIGIAVAPVDAEGTEKLFKATDIALYRAKYEGRGTYRFFEAGMDQALQARREMEGELIKALPEEQFKLYYQPQACSKTGHILGYEALLRWIHPKRGIISPLHFIPLAEDTGLIKPIGQWVLNQACLDAASWADPARVAVNLSAMQLADLSVVQEVSAALSSSGLEPARLELEVTESILMQDAEKAVETLETLKGLGIRLSMDDFGTGYSSLSYLRKFPFDKVKIDKSFIDEIGASDDSLAIVRAVLNLSGNLGKATTAEGVETTEQAQILEAEGCTEIQGYLISKPMPLEDIEEFSKAHKTALNV